MVKAEPTPHAQDLLSTPCEGDEKLHDALSWFLYLRPEEQVARLGTPEQLIRKAAEESGRGDLNSARVDYADAAWIELYRGDKSGARASLERALSLGDGNGLASPSAPRLDTILADLDRAMVVARRYYHKDETEPMAESNE
ncbi:MAG: hypothetical protein JRN06_04685 [Nitrososphaerota archaeon]|nr:hypothetical protein [Nitrososphaerota archaeon]MDG7023914.1 hypothetical protein [Nitrososphaerota archaeon]